MSPVQEIIKKFNKEFNKINFANWFSENKDRLLKEEKDLVQKSIVEPSETDIIDYDPVEYDRFKNAIARKEGFSDWKDLMYKSHSGSLELIYDKQLKTAFNKIKDLKNEIEDHTNDILQMRELTNDIEELVIKK